MTRRTLDLMVGVAALVALMPLLVLIGLAVLIDSGRPVLFRQTRVGRRGETFEILKFRTMTEAATGEGPFGPRRAVTRVGAHLRARKLDELPQLVNVVGGSMSIVGPRPETPRWVARFPAEFDQLLQRRPGLIDPASLQFRDEEAILAASDDPETCYAEVVLPQKLALSLEFHHHRSVGNDVRFLCGAARELARSVR